MPTQQFSIALLQWSFLCNL